MKKLLAILVVVLFALVGNVYADDDKDECEDKCKKIYRNCIKQNAEKECKPALKRCKNKCEEDDDDSDSDDDKDDNDKDDDDNDKDDDDNNEPDPKPELPPETEVDGGSTILVSTNIYVIKPDGSLGAKVATLLCPYNQCKFYSVPFWNDDTVIVDPDPEPDPDPDPEPGPNDWVTKENFDSRSCLKCHDKDGDDQKDKFDYRKYVDIPEQVQKTHKEHKERQCKSCHTDPR